MTGRVAGVVLAAGTASRLGTPKQLLPLGGRPLLAHALDAARAARTLDRRYVVLGHEAARVRAGVDLSGFTVIVNPDYASGQSASVRAAVAALPPDIDAVVFLLGDQPAVSPALIDRLVEHYRASGAPVVQPRYAEGRGNPVLIARPLFAELLALTGDTGARPVIAAHAGDVGLVEVPDLHRPDDVDTMDDYDRIRDAFATRARESTP